MEFASKGDYFRYFQKVGKLGEYEVAQVIYQLLLALKYIHDKDIIHRDIKLENILMDEDKVIKLCDFGWCSPPGDPQRNLLAGTYEYMAPEVVKREKYSTKIDIWSIGVLAFELLHRYTPFKGPNVAAITGNIVAGQYNIDYNVSQDFRDFIKKCLAYKPADRPTAQQLLEHPVFNDVRHQQFSRKSLRQTRLSHIGGRATYMPDHSIMATSNVFDPNQRGFPQNASTLEWPQDVNHKNLDNNLMQRLTATPPYGNSSPDTGPIHVKSPASNQYSNFGGQNICQSQLYPMDDPFSAKYSPNSYPTNPQTEWNQGQRDSYQPAFEVNFEEKPQITFDNLGQFIEFDIKVSEVVEMLSSGGNAVVGFFGGVINGVQNLLLDLDEVDNKKENRYKKDKSSKKRGVLDDIDDKEPKLLTFSDQKLNREEGNWSSPISNNEGTSVRDTNDSVSTPSISRGPIIYLHKNQPLSSYQECPEPPPIESPNTPSEPTFFDNILDFFGFSSKNDDLKHVVKIQQAQKEEKKKYLQKKKDVEANSLYEDYKGSN